MSNFIIDTR